MKVTGFTKIIDWYNNKGIIELDPFIVDNKKEIFKNLNDNGFGCKKIIGGYIYIDDKGPYYVNEKTVRKVKKLPNYVYKIIENN